jgi:hypothetical protein
MDLLSKGLPEKILKPSTIHQGTALVAALVMNQKIIYEKK